MWPQLIFINQGLTVCGSGLSHLFDQVFVCMDRNRTAGSGFSFILETEDIEGAVANAVKAGAVSEGEIEEGENALRLGKVKDPYGMMWAITSPTIVKKMKKSEEENAEA